MWGFKFPLKKVGFEIWKIQPSNLNNSFVQFLDFELILQWLMVRPKFYWWVVA
jgi:hypothetical protein